MKIALILNDDFSMWHFRGGLIRALVAKGVDVAAIVPPGKYHGKLRELGARTIPVPMARFASPLRDLWLIWALYRVFRRQRFDIVHTMTIKPNIYGTLAARLARVGRVVGLVSGAGYLFNGSQGAAVRLLRGVTLPLYRWALNASDGVWFQNPDDLEEFARRGLVAHDRGLVIRSGGINLDEFAPAVVPEGELLSLRRELGLPQGAKCVVMVAARMIWSKGVREFMEAAAANWDLYPSWAFVMLCPRDQGTYDAVPRDYIASQRGENLVVIDEFRDDVKRFVALADIMVLPSYYREGVPRSLLEGLAMGKPIVTTSNVGCREVVHDGVNGYIVPPQDGRAFCQKLRALMEDAAALRRFGTESRRIAERDFDEKSVVARVMTELYRI